MGTGSSREAVHPPVPVVSGTLDPHAHAQSKVPSNEAVSESSGWDQGVCESCQMFFSDGPDCRYYKMVRPPTCPGFIGDCSMCFVVASILMAKPTSKRTMRTYPVFGLEKCSILRHPMYLSLPAAPRVLDPEEELGDSIRSNWDNHVPERFWSYRGVAGADDSYGFIVQLDPNASWLAAGQYVDFGRLKQLIGDPAEEEPATAARQLPTGMRLINVNTRQIISASPHHEYVALSYVWGSGSGPDQPQERLPDQVPRTIEDSLSAVASLGLEYIWIDRYCIHQGDSKEKAAQIHMMHQIYQNAYVTIIAAAGSGPDHGLPGVSRPRSWPLRAVIDGRVFLAIRNPEYKINQTVWATRAWTFQEDKLSSRKLFFLDDEVFFQCSRTKRSALEGHVRNTLPLQVFEPDGGNSSEDRRATILSDLWGSITTLNNRNISFESDRVNTTLGIFGYLTDHGLIAGHVCGIPILSTLGSIGDRKSVRSWTEGFMTSLLWGTGQRSARRGRRAEFPSWTWAGWFDEIDAPNQRCLYDNVTVSLEINEQLLSAPEAQQALNAKPTLGLAIRHIHIEAPVAQFKFGSSFLKSLWYLDNEGRARRTGAARTSFQMDPNQLEYGVPSGNAGETLTPYAWLGLLFTGCKDTGRSAFVLLIQDHGDHFERVALCEIRFADLLFDPTLDGISVFSDDVESELGRKQAGIPKLLVHMRSVRLG